MSVFRLESMFGLIYFSLSLALNIFLTASIVLRLWYCRAQTQTALGKGYGRHFTFLSILFVESAFPNALCSVFLLLASVKVTYWRSGSHLWTHSGSPYDDIHFALWDAMFQVMLALTPPVQVRYIPFDSILLRLD